MNEHLQNILNTIHQDKNLSEEEKNAIIKSLKDADKEFEITNFKLDRTEKVKKTTAILLEETIEELEQKRKSVEAQNKELEIESALERVRTVAMAMRKAADLLDICEIVYDELQSLGFNELRNAMINIHYDDKDSLFNYDYAENVGKTVTNIPYNFHPLVEKQVMVTKNAQDAFFEFSFTGNELKQFRELRKNNGEQDDPKLEITDALHYYFYSIGTGSIGISTYSAINEEKLKLLQRFRNVFNLSYQRYVDISLAETQAKEARIETALERVRAVAMAMRKSDDLLNICEVLYKELGSLGFSGLRNALISAFEEGKDYFADYDYAVTTGGSITYVPYKSHPIVEAFQKKIRQSPNSFLELVVDKSELNSWKEYRKRNNQPEDPRLDNCSALYYYMYSLGISSIGISSFDALTKDKVAVLERFANVFRLAYQRYIDISNAEAQAREARIETALERVRAVAMAMKRSEELVSVSEVMCKELTSLGFSNIRNAQIAIENDEKQSFIFYNYSDDKKQDITIAPYNSWSILTDIKQRLHGSGDFYEEEYTGEKLNEWRNWKIKTNAPLDERELSAESLRWYLYAIGKGHMGISTFNAISGEQIEIVKRFKNVFELSYRRFDDLQKAEAQAREAQIETALERVRSRSLAMQKSEELKEVIQVVYEQFVYLNVNTEHTGFVIDYKLRDDRLIWVASKHGVPSQLTIPYFDSEYYNSFNEAKEKGWDFFATNLSFEDKNIFYRELFKYIPELPDEAKEFYFSCPGLAISTVLLENVGLYIENFEGIPYSDEDNAILMRFGKVFQQTYTRFLDLQKAEKQSRENQIQLALERARSQSMIMQHSNELDDTLRVFHEQVLLLNIPSAFSFLWLPDEEKDKHLFWAAWKENENDSIVFKSKAINYPLDRNEPATAQCLIDWKGNEPIVSYHVPPSGVKNYFAAWQELINGVEQLKPEYFSGGLYYVEAFMKYGCFGVIVTNDITEDEKKILGRFAIEFERTYQRFLDLQKAEAQTREAQIEMALEKVRSRTMAMQRSDELPGTAALLFQEFKKLEQQELIQTTIGIYNETKNEIEFRATSWEGGGEQVVRPSYGSMDEPTLLKPAVTAWKAQAKSLVVDLSGEKLEGWVNYRNKMTDVTISSKDAGGRRVVSIAFFSKGHISLSSPLPLPAETLKTLERFAAVFDGTFTRFLDLQKSESQAREAKIEASLERVRSKAMSMQKSEDLAAAITIVFEELDKLDLSILRCGIGILNKEKRTADVYSTTIADNDNVIQVSGDESMDIHPLLSGAFDAWLNHEEHSYTLKGEDLNNYYKAVAGENFKLPTSQSLVSGNEELTQYYYNAVWSSGGLFAFRDNPFPEEAKIILRRFADVFTLTYTRFSDLKQAEAQAKEAKIEVALERVRSRTLAMQKSDELAETAAVLFRQLISLGIAPNRLYIGIIKDDEGHIEFWVTDEDGSKVNTQFTGDAGRNISMKKMYDAWKEQRKSLTIDMQGKELSTYFHYLADELNVPFKQGLEQKRRIQTVAFFGKGFIGIASPDEQPEETTLLLERFAAVFNLTYTRFNDLKVAEAHAIQAEEDLIKLQTEKKRAEDALTELRSTQTQLIQSEKMASLGELTAGIAHEIQNPLNFVNNFSEVSNELLDEMNEEIAKENYEEVKAIAADVKQNLEKINHHGKRADAIVKGMLQHSRATSATKESTDINKLADEYLRLAYHGLRAKDKSFNATLKTDYDETIGNINIIPQDIGRVILNLITNAFYVVGEKKKLKIDKYEPTVSVSTKKINDKVEIKVVDNGNGIPKNILDKIFQPFFTTKPTGQGTGLGLSLAYDIVKAHGGELKVETKEGEGSEFIIQLPII